MSAKGTRITKRFHEPSLRAVVAGVPFKTSNFSLGGVAVRNYVGDARRGDVVEVVLSEGLYTDAFRVKATVIRQEPDKTLRLKFVEQGQDDALRAVQAFLTEMATGKTRTHHATA